MEAAQEGPHHIGSDIEHPELLELSSHFSHLRSEHGPGMPHLRVGLTDGH